MKHKLIGRMAEKMGAPEGVIGNSPLVSIFGTEKVTVEGHGAIFEYTQDRIRVDSADGLITVKGSNLTITFFSEQFMEITGIIKSVEVGEG